MNLKILGLASAALLLAAQPSTAQLTSMSAQPVLYRLDAPSSYEQGCQAPCMCPIWINENLLGTFTLAYSHSTPDWFDHYTVGEVNWVLAGPSGDARVSGSGTYRLGGAVLAQHQLVLQLSIDGGPVETYDSGLVPGGLLPGLVIDIAKNNFFCYDQIFSVVASPVPAHEPTRFRLRQSRHENGCYAPCLCPISMQRVRGSFALVELEPGSTSTRQYFGWVDTRWAPTTPAPTPNRGWRGNGVFVIDHANARQNLVLDLVDGVGVSRRYKSGDVALTAPFPRIEIDIAVNGFYCLDWAFFVRAMP